MLRRRLTAAASPMLVRAATTAASAVPGGGSVVSSLLKSTAIFGAANGLGFGISAATGSHLHLDLIGTGVFAVAAMSMAGGGDVRQRVSAGAIAIWATKLSSFLFYRALQTRHDGRLTDVLSTNSGAFGFWFISFAWGFVVSLPHAIAAGVPVAGRPTFGRMTDILGLALYAVGLTVESAADYQKWTFKADPANRGKFCDAGVWKISQHPNWFGNFCLWLGIWSLNAPTLVASSPPGIGWAGRICRLVGGALSPLFLFGLFYAQATDTIAHTAKLAEQRYGADPNFARYAESTPLVVPSLASLGRLFR